MDSWEELWVLVWGVLGCMSCAVCDFGVLLSAECFERPCTDSSSTCQ